MEKTLWSRVFNSDSDNRKSKIENLKSAGPIDNCLRARGSWGCGSGAAAEKIFRIGLLDDSTASNIAVRLDTFRQELSKLGWIEGKNVAIEYRYAEGKLEHLPELAADLVRLKVDLIVASGTPVALAAKNATTTIPIVITNAGDPVGAGLVNSLARPGGNVTGFSSLASELNHQKVRDT